MASEFEKQAVALMESLKDLRPMFIRCIKPNDQKLAGFFDHRRVLQQLQFSGMCEALLLMKQGRGRACAPQSVHDVLDA